MANPESGLDSPQLGTKRIINCSANGPYSNCVGGSISQPVETIICRPGTTISSRALAVNAISTMCSIKFVSNSGVIQTPSDNEITVTYNLQDYDGGAHTIAVAACTATGFDSDMNSAPYTNTQNFQNGGMGASALQPISFGS